MSLQTATIDGEVEQGRTAHAMLVIWGLFARRMGLVQELEKVPIPQRRRKHTPQTKLIEFLVAILNGYSYLQDISHGPHPLDHDQTVAQAWGQPQWADYSGVSRTLHACTSETVEAVGEAIARATRPFIDREVVLALRQAGEIVYDGDLTGRPVSPNSKTYPGVAFGWMDDALQLGYQAALVSMRSPSYGRIWLSVTHHAGDTVASTQAEAMVRAAEARTGVRPLRRTDMLAGRLEEQRKALCQEREKLAKRKQRHEQIWQQLQATAQEWRQWREEVTHLEALYHKQGRPERPYSRLARARNKMGVCRRRLERKGPALRRVHLAMEKQKQRVQESCVALLALQERYTRFVEENRKNRAPIRAIFRLDAGFGSGQNLALLIEMGYEVYSKALNANLTQSVQRQVTADDVWIQVSHNAYITAWKERQLPFCPYPLDTGLECFLIDGKMRYATLVHYGQDPVVEDLPAWFAYYNARQTIEAGVKEGKQVFEMHHLKVRSLPGLVIQEQFAALAANLVRWAAYWLHQQCPHTPIPFDQPRPSVKHMVRVAANALAWVYWLPEGYLLLKFDTLSSFGGVELRIAPGNVLQLPLPLFRNDVFY